MSALRRVRRLEDDGDPWTGVARWLDEAHRHGTLTDYVLATLDSPPSQSPFVVVPERVRAGIRASARVEGIRGPDLRDTEERAVRDTVFLLQLVMHSEREALELLQLAALRVDGLRWRMRAIEAEAALGALDDHGVDTGSERGVWRQAVVDLAADLATADRARILLADHYTGGTDVRFPRTREAFDVIGEMVDGLLVIAAASGLGGERKAREEVRGRAGAHAHRAATQTVDWIRAQALDLLGDRPAGTLIIARQLRVRSEATSAADSPFAPTP